MVWIPDREFYCSADQELFSWLRTRIFKTTCSTQIFVREYDKNDENWKRFRNKLSSPKEFFSIESKFGKKMKNQPYIS